MCSNAFARQNQPPRDPIGGMGLGLAIVRHLIELHGGTVTAASDGEDHGSTFTDSLAVGRSEKRRAAHAVSQNDETATTVTS